MKKLFILILSAGMAAFPFACESAEWCWCGKTKSLYSDTTCNQICGGSAPQVYPEDN